MKRRYIDCSISTRHASTAWFDELHRLLLRSGIIEMIGNVKQLQVHRLMYLHLWGDDPKQHRLQRKIPFKPMSSGSKKT
jgi:hypothetical protein